MPNDNERTRDDATFREFLKLLPEEQVRDFLDWLANGQYPEEFNDMCRRYEAFWKNTLSRFLDDGLSRSFRKLNQSFDDLWRFLIREFWETTPYSHMYMLYPDHRHSQEKMDDKTKEQFWNERFEVLQKLGDVFQKNYGSFIKLAGGFGAGRKFPYNLPSGAQWKDFIFQFLNRDSVLIKVNKYVHEADYKEIGCADGRNFKPDSQWALLLMLAKLGGEIAWKDTAAEISYKKTKERLTDDLQAYFDLREDPFDPYVYKKKRSYKIKITLIPPSEDRDDRGAIDDGRDALGREMDKMFGDLIENDSKYQDFKRKRGD